MAKLESIAAADFKKFLQPGENQAQPKLKQFFYDDIQARPYDVPENSAIVAILYKVLDLEQNNSVLVAEFQGKKHNNVLILIKYDI